MAYLDDSPYAQAAVAQIAATADPGAVLTKVKALVWYLIQAHAHESYKGRIYGVPYSVKMAKFAKVFERIFGPPPFDFRGDG